MGRGGRIGSPRGGSRGFSGSSSFSRGFSTRRSSPSAAESNMFSGRQRLGRGGGISRSGYYRRAGGSSLWPFLLFPRSGPTVIINNQTEQRAPYGTDETFTGETGQIREPGLQGPEKNKMGADMEKAPSGGAGQGPERKQGSAKGILILLAVLVVIAEFILIPIAFSGGDKEGARQKLPADMSEEVPYWYDDRLSWIYDEDGLLSGMEEFYEETGVQPYLLICSGLSDPYGPSENDEDYLSGLYDRLFQDEGHLIYVFMEFSPSQYVSYIYTGALADSVIDDEAKSIMLDTADRLYYDSGLSDEEFFSEVFSESAEEIMEDPGTGAFGRILAGILAILIPIAVGIYGYKLYGKQKEEERRKRVKEILETPIGESPEEEALREKYKEEKGGRNI